MAKTTQLSGSPDKMDIDETHEMNQNFNKTNTEEVVDIEVAHREQAGSQHAHENSGSGSDDSDDSSMLSSTSSSSGYLEPWIDAFLGKKGNEYFCEVDVDYITDRFNLMGLNKHVSTRFSNIISFIVDEMEEEQLSKITGEDYEQLCKDAFKLYGLIHARYIITMKGLDKMMHKFKDGDFGRCPRYACDSQAMLPVGLHDYPGKDYVKLYCPACEDIYVPKSSRHSSLDGSFFGTTFPGIFLQQYPSLVPTKPIDNYVPKINGFELHKHAQWARWQELQRLKHLNSLQNKYNLKNMDGGFSVPGAYRLPAVNEKVYSSATAGKSK